jgi:hypothetical protein
MNAFQFSSQYGESMFDKFDSETGRTTPPEIRDQIRAIMVEKDYAVMFNNHLHLATFEDMHKYANLFFAQHWTVYISKVPCKFITSDNPVAMTFPKAKSIYGPTFLERIHYFSLTPEICIQAAFPNSDTGKKFHRKTLFRGQELRVLDLNVTIANFSHQYAYGTERQSLENVIAAVKKLEDFVATPQGKLVKRMLDEGQDLCRNPARAAAAKHLLSSWPS